MREPVDRRSLLKTLAGVMTAGAVTSRWGIPGEMSAQQAVDLRVLQERDTVVLLVPGFMAQLYETVSTFAHHRLDTEVRNHLRNVPVIGERLAEGFPSLRAPIAEGTAVSFFTQEKKFESLGIRRVNLARMPGSTFNTSQGVTANGQAIAAALTQLRNENVRRVVIVSHSKGGLDTLEALTVNEGFWNAPVVGWVALQAPFYGSPVVGPSADSFVARTAAHSEVLELARRAIQNAAPLAQAVRDLTPAGRASYMTQRSAAIARLTGAIPVRSYYSRYQASPSDTFWAAASSVRDLFAGVFNGSLLEEIAKTVAANEARHPADQPRALGEAATESRNLIRERVHTAVHNVLRSVGLMDTFNLAMREPNDGLVAVSSTQLPGAVVRELLPSNDHAAPVMMTAPFHEFWQTAHRDDLTLQYAADVARRP